MDNNSHKNQNDSQNIATYAELLIYTVKFHMPKNIILKGMIPNLFCPAYVWVMSFQLHADINFSHSSSAEVPPNHIYSRAIQSIEILNRTALKF